MNYYPLLTLLLSCLFLSACAASQKKNEDPSPMNTDQVDPEETPVQSMAPSPGSVTVIAEIIGVEETNRGYHCTLKITEVQKYGAGTPPLGEGSEVIAVVRHATLESFAPETQAAEVMKAGNTMNLTLQHQEAPNLGGKSTPSWRVLTIR